MASLDDIVTSLKNAVQAINGLNIAVSRGANSYTLLPQLPAYTVATVPSATSFPYGLIYVTDESTGAQPAFSDGTNWRTVSGRAIIS